MDTDSASRRALMLLRTHRFEEMASFLESVDAKIVFFNIVPLISMDNLLFHLPQSLQAIEALLLHVCAISDHSATLFVTQNSELIAMKIVRFYAADKSEKTPENSKINLSVTNIVRVLALMDPMVKKYLLKRKRILDRCLSDMGRHTLVHPASNTSSGLTSLHEALKTEMEGVILRFRSALKRMDVLSLTHGRPKERSLTKGPPPSSGSHQRLLQVTQHDIEDRLYKNTEVFNAIRADVETPTLKNLTNALEERIGMDKELLLHYTQLRKEMSLKLNLEDDNREDGLHQEFTPPLDLTSVSAILKSYIRGFSIVLEAMRVSRQEIDKNAASASSPESRGKQKNNTSHNDSSTNKFWRKHNQQKMQNGSRKNERKHHSEGEEEEEEDDSVTLAFSPRMEGICTLHRRRTIRNNKGSKVRKSSGDERLAEERSKNEQSSDQSERSQFESSLESKSSTRTEEEKVGSRDKGSDFRRESQEGDRDRDDEIRRLREELREANRTIESLKSSSRVDGGVEILNSDEEYGKSNMSGGNPWYDDDYTSPSSNGLSSSPDSIQQQINIDQKNRDRKANKRNIKDNQNNNTIKENNNETTSINNNHVTKDENIHAKVNGSNNHTIDEVDIHAIKETTDIHTNDEVTIKILAKRYEDLYRVAQETTLESLETNPALEKIDDLKTKLLFSIIVLAFRVTFRHRVELWTRVRVMLQLPVLPSVSGEWSEKQKNPPCAAVESSLSVYLQRTVDHFDLTICVQEVCDQVWQTLYDFPSLKKSASLINFVKDSVRIAWALVSVTPSSLVDFGSPHFDSTRHILHSSSSSSIPSDLSSTNIKRFIWPTLVDAETGKVRSKGVVVL